MNPATAHAQANATMRGIYGARVAADSHDSTYRARLTAKCRDLFPRASAFATGIRHAAPLRCWPRCARRIAGTTTAATLDHRQNGACWRFLPPSNGGASKYCVGARVAAQAAELRPPVAGAWHRRLFRAVARRARPLLRHIKTLHAALNTDNASWIAQHQPLILSWWPHPARP